MVGRLSIPFFSFYRQDKNQQDFSSGYRFPLTSLMASSASGSASLASLVICSEGTVSFSLTSRWDQRVELTSQEVDASPFCSVAEDDIARAGSVLREKRLRVGNLSI
jgi:hypothetical protein